MSKKSTCIITLPRTGSELLMYHLSAAYKLENGGEFLCQNGFNPKQLIKKESGNTFRDSFDLAPLDISGLTTAEFREFVKKDFNERLDLIRNYKNGVVVKTFTYSQYYKYFPSSIDRILEEFNVVILTRRNSYKSLLSSFICEQLGVWHVLDADELKRIEDRFLTLRFSISEDVFIKLVQDTNILNTLHRNISRIDSSVRTLYFDDFADNLTDNLNLLLGTNVKSHEVPKLNKFISDHEAPIINIDKIRSLYKLYTI